MATAVHSKAKRSWWSLPKLLRSFGFLDPKIFKPLDFLILWLFKSVPDVKVIPETREYTSCALNLISLLQTSWGNLKLLLTPYSICRHIWFFINHPLLHRLSYKLLGGNHFTKIVNNKIILIIKHKHTTKNKPEKQIVKPRICIVYKSLVKPTHFIVVT